MKTMVARILLVLAFIASSAPAYAIASASSTEAQQTCLLGAYYKNPGKSSSISDNYNTCSADLRHGAFTDATYKAIRVEPGFARNPIDVAGMCYYIDNRSDQSYFVPAQTPQELSAFLNHTPAQVDAVPCCRPQNVANVCDPQHPIVLSYSRANTTDGSISIGHAGKEVGFTCVNGQYVQTADNGRPCELNGATPAAATTTFDRNATPAAVQTNYAVQQGWAIQRNFQN